VKLRLFSAACACACATALAFASIVAVPGAHAATASTTTTTTTTTVPTPTVEGPVTTGNNKIVVQSTAFDLASVGYEQSESFISGTATSYTTPSTFSADGKWTVATGETSAYKTRLVVYRPSNPKKFNGTVMVEWLNVSGGLDAGANWTLSHVEQIREGMAWVGVTAQRVGIEGGSNPLTASQALRNADPVRYGSLSIPSDKFSYDIFSQAGQAVRKSATTVLGGLQPKHVIGVGESQSAIFLTSYLNAVVPITAKVYDGYMIHSRAGFAAPFDGNGLTNSDRTPVRIRTDLGVLVMIFTTEADLFGLSYLPARQPDTARIRDWEVAGTAHYDTYGLGIGQKDAGDGTADVALFQTMITPVTSPYPGIVDCTKPINAGPHTYVLRAATAALNKWVATGTPPPRSPRLQANSLESGTFVLDANGNALGGIRTPFVDAPIAALSGVGQSGNGFCRLFGTTTTFDAAKLAALYPSHAAFVKDWNAATDKAVKAGFVLKADAPAIKAAAAQSTVGS
jgi:Alpha/beta hydrolase domain